MRGIRKAVAGLPVEGLVPAHKHVPWAGFAQDGFGEYPVVMAGLHVNAVRLSQVYGVDYRIGMKRIKCSGIRDMKKCSEFYDDIAVAVCSIFCVAFL